MDNLNLGGYADSGSYKLWIKAGVAALAVGFVIIGLGGLFAPDSMRIIGDFLRKPGGVLVTAGVAIAGLKGDDLSDGVRVGAIIAAGLMGLLAL